MFGTINESQSRAIIGVQAINELEKREGSRLEHLENLAAHRNRTIAQLIADIIVDHLNDSYCNDAWLGDDLYPGNARMQRESEYERQHALWAGR